MSDQQISVLIVEDDSMHFTLMKKAIETHSHCRVEWAPSKERCFYLLQAEKFDIVLLDYILPSIDGLQVLREIKNANFSIPVVMVTGHGDEHVAVEAMKLGASDYVVKDKDYSVRLNLVIQKVVEENRLKMDMEKLRQKQMEMELELMEKKRLASVGLLMRGIAHNLNTPLGAIMGRAELIKMKNPDLKGVDEIINQCEVMASIIQNMMYKSQQEQTRTKQILDLNKLLTEELKFLEGDMFFKHQIKRVLNFDEKLPQIEGVYGDFSESFINIVKNALDAMYDTEKKELTITTKFDDEFLYVDFHDTGIGIKEENMDKIFNPFFTTKPTYRTDGGPTGVGLGLHSSYKFLEPYGAKITVRSKPGDTTFTVKIPYKQMAK